MVGALLITFIVILLNIKFLQTLKKVNSNNGGRWQLVETEDQRPKNVNRKSQNAKRHIARRGCSAVNAGVMDGDSAASGGGMVQRGQWGRMGGGGLDVP